MKRTDRSKSCPGTPIPPEEYRIFTNQPKEVLRSYRLARISMETVLPFFVLITVFHTGISLTLAAAGGIAALIPLRKKYGLKGAVVPLFCAIAGVLIGALLIRPLIRPTEILKEVYRGFR